MSNPLTEARTRLKELLDNAGLDAHLVLPEKAAPPFTYVAPGDPYVTREGATFGGQILRLNVGAVVDRGVNETTTERLDERLLEVVDAIESDPSGDFVVGEANPGQIRVNGQDHLGVSVEVLIEIHRS